MDNDIKEMNLSEMLFNRDERLLDYITNLQEENKRLKEWKEDLLNENIELENIRKEAIEYIKFRQEDDENYCLNIQELLNILFGDDKE